ncbi:MAG: phospho-N-acetylmuramoyl-pentapeptide-transferase, partial [Muribaculaceae bacterium]|nr:phospho-N-acetylmuramoyl-pentapeptide-transferase [Muribaculaceae bacterium]
MDETDQEKKDDVAKALEKDRKSQTPSMGGLIIIVAILLPCLLIGKLNNVYMLLMILATLWCGALGFLDDYIKIAHHDKRGLKGKFKVIGQVGLGIVVALVMWASPAIVMSENTEVRNPETGQMEVVHAPQVKGTQTTIPFIKNHNFDYARVAQWFGIHGKAARGIGWLIFAALAIFIVTAVSNAANLTDGLDGLASSTSAVYAIALAIMAYLSGNVIYAAYLNIMYIPDSSELVIFAAAFIGATLGFLWYNSYPAQVFMGDTGSLCLGGIVGVFALLLRKEWLLPILCGVFFVEALSNMIQTGYFKYTKRKTGTGKRIFKMAPIHHHYQIPAGKIKNVMFQKPAN